MSRQEWHDERNRRADELQTQTEPLICKYFSLIDQEIALISDTVEVSIPSATPANENSHIPSLEPIHNNSEGKYSAGLASYAKTLADTLNEWAAQSNSTIRASVTGGVNSSSGMACVTVKLGNRTNQFHEETPSDETILSISNLAQSTTSQVGHLEYLRGVIVFDGPSVRIFKPLALLGWTQTAALNDAAEIYASIVAARPSLQEHNG